MSLLVFNPSLCHLSPLFSSHFISKGEPEELIKHGLRALRETLPNEQELTTKVCWSSVNIQALSFWY